MRRTGAVTQKVPTFSSDDYKTFMIGDFKGIDKSVNPFNAIKSSAEECLNLYVDDEGTLVTRPRLDYHSQTPVKAESVFEFDYNENHYHAICGVKDASNKVSWEISIDFKTWTTVTDDGGNTVTEMFNNGDVLYALINDEIYTTAIDLETSKISFTKAIPYIPTSGTLDSSTNIRVTAGEQENRLINKVKTEVFWKPQDVETFENLDFEYVSNKYYDNFIELQYENKPITTYKVYESANVIVGITSANIIVVFDTSGNVKSAYPIQDAVKSIDFDYYSKNDSVCVAYTVTSETATQIKAFQFIGSLSRQILNDTICSNSCIATCCVIEDSNECFIGGLLSNGIFPRGWVVRLNTPEATVVREGYVKISTDPNMTRVWWSSTLNRLICIGTYDPILGFSVGIFKNEVTDTAFVNCVFTWIKSGSYATINHWHLTNTKSKCFLNTNAQRYVIDLVSANGVDKTVSLTNVDTGWATFENGEGYYIHIAPSVTKLKYKNKVFYEQPNSETNTTIVFTYLFADGSFLTSTGKLLTYIPSTKPQLTIIETTSEELTAELERIGRYNNNYVYWSTKSNKVYYTANNDPLYIPKAFYDDYGDDTPVTSVMRISDSYLAILKKDATYLAWYDVDTGYFYANELRTEKGNIAIGQAIVCNYSNLPVVVNTDGFWGLGQSTSVNYQDTVYSALSDSLRVELQKLDLTKCKTHNHKYLTYFAVPGNKSTTIYVLDNRIQMWFKWVIPIELKFFTEYEDYTYIYTATSVFKLDPYVAKTNGDLQDAWYADIVNSKGRVKHIPWLWVSQPLFLGTLNYKKRIRYLKFLFDNKYESDSVTMRYGFLSYKQSERPTKLREYTSPFTRNEFSNEITGITKDVATLKTKKIRPYIPSFDFIQIILRSNNDSDEFEDADGNIITPTLNDKVGLIGITINYILQEG